jgi:hypothetical protein
LLRKYSIHLNLLERLKKIDSEMKEMHT